MKPNLNIAASEHANGRKQIVFSLQTPHILLRLISFFVEIPPTNFLSIAREEHVNIQRMTLLSIRWRLIRNSKRHSETQSLAGLEWVGEVHTTIRVGDISSAIVAVYGETASLPAGEAEGRVWRCKEANCNAGIDFVLPTSMEEVAAAAKPKNLHFKIDGLGVLCD